MTPDTIPTASGAGAVQRARLDELDARTLYELLRLRSDVFVVEQDCVFLDLDGRDLEPDAEQLWVADEAGVAAELRLLREQDDEWSLGRMVARADVRATGVASRLLRAGLDRLRELGCRTVTIGAQAHLVDWYGRFGFERSGPRYLEDGILHVPMRRSLDPGAAG